MEKFLQPLTVAALTFFVFIFTRNAITGVFKIQITLFLIIAFAIYSYLVTKKGEVLTTHPKFIYLFLATILFLVGSTGWFFSPFFFILYLSTILLAFVFNLASSLSFVLMLVLLFSLNIGEVDLTYDFLVVLSLLTTIPLSLYLRKEYLRLKEAEKGILILEKEKEKYQSRVDEVLSNKINNFAANLRQPINDMRLLGYRLLKVKKAELGKYSERLITASEEALSVLKTFESESTGTTVLSTPQKPKTKNF